MSATFKKTTQVTALSSLVLLFFVSGIYLAGGRINTSKSISVGLYWITQKRINKGDFVLFCPPQKPIFKEAYYRGYINAGFCPGHYSYLMKRVLATKDDIVSIGSSGVWVNHQLVPYSTPFTQDVHALPLPQLHVHHYVLKPSELLLMTDQSELSFDSRYFGIISATQIRAVIRPVLTWPLKNKI